MTLFEVDTSAGIVGKGVVIAPSAGSLPLLFAGVLVTLSLLVILVRVSPSDLLKPTDFQIWDGVRCQVCSGSPSLTLPWDLKAISPHLLFLIEHLWFYLSHLGLYPSKVHLQRQLIFFHRASPSPSQPRADLSFFQRQNLGPPWASSCATPALFISASSHPRVTCSVLLWFLTVTLLGFNI